MEIVFWIFLGVILSPFLIFMFLIAAWGFGFIDMTGRPVPKKYRFNKRNKTNL